MPKPKDSKDDEESYSGDSVPEKDDGREYDPIDGTWKTIEDE